MPSRSAWGSSEMPTCTVFLKPSAEKSLRKLPVSIQKRIVTAIDDLRSDPRPAGCVKLAGAESADAYWRIRVGDYRIVYALRDRELIVLVVRIAHRKDVYRGR